MSLTALYGLLYAINGFRCGQVPYSKIRYTRAEADLGEGWRNLRPGGKFLSKKKYVLRINQFACQLF